MTSCQWHYKTQTNEATCPCLNKDSKVIYRNISSCCR